MLDDDNINFDINSVSNCVIYVYVYFYVFLYFLPIYYWRLFSLLIDNCVLLYLIGFVFNDIDFDDDMDLFINWVNLSLSFCLLWFRL